MPGDAVLHESRLGIPRPIMKRPLSHGVGPKTAGQGVGETEENAQKDQQVVVVFHITACCVQSRHYCERSAGPGGISVELCTTLITKCTAQSLNPLRNTHKQVNKRQTDKRTADYTLPASDRRPIGEVFLRGYLAAHHRFANTPLCTCKTRSAPQFSNASDGLFFLPFNTHI
jgi:hypothetical protein